MTVAHCRSPAPLLPEEDTVILLTEKNNTIHHLLLSLHLSSSISLCVWALMLCCYVSVFVPLKVLKLLQVLWMPGSDQITYSNIIEQQKLISDPGRNKIIPKDVIYPDWSPYTALFFFFLWLGIIFTSISSHIGPTHPLQLVDSEQDRPSHGAINIYSVHSSSSYCSVVWRGRIIFAQKVYVVISCHCQHWTNALLLPEVPHREGYIIFSLTFIAFLLQILIVWSNRNLLCMSKSRTGCKGSAVQIKHCLNFISLKQILNSLNH